MQKQILLDVQKLVESWFSLDSKGSIFGEDGDKRTKLKGKFLKLILREQQKMQDKMDKVDDDYQSDNEYYAELP